MAIEPTKDKKTDALVKPEFSGDIDLNEPTRPALVDLEALAGFFPSVTTIPTWAPKTFQESVAVDSANGYLYVYDWELATWFTVGSGGGGGTPGGSDTQFQFNDGGSFGGAAGLTYDKTIPEIVATAFIRVLSGSYRIYAAPLSGNGGTFSIEGAESTANNGGNLLLKGGDGDASGGDAVLRGGGGTGGQGTARVEGGSSSTSAEGGPVVLIGGTGTGELADVVVNDVIATGDNHGFLVLPMMAGTPTGTPDTDGACVFDTTTNKLWIYKGGWKSVTLT